MYNSITDFVHMAKELRLKLSHKGTIVSKIPQASKTLVKLLKQQGVDYQVGQATRDLGINYTLSPKINVRRTILKKRFEDTKGPLKRIQMLARISRRARVLFSGAAYSKST